MKIISEIFKEAIGFTKPLILLMFLTTCASNKSFKNPTDMAPGIDTAFNPYVDNFKRIVSPHYNKKAYKTMRMQFEDLEGMTAGICWKLPDDNGDVEVSVQIDRKVWARASEGRRDALIMHELGHCLCNLGHQHFEGAYKEETFPFSEKLGYLEDGCPVTVMHPNLMTGECFEAHKSLYEYELKLRCMSSRQSYK
jgi:hypothetical protein